MLVLRGRSRTALMLTSIMSVAPWVAPELPLPKRTRVGSKVTADATGISPVVKSAATAKELQVGPWGCCVVGGNPRDAMQQVPGVCSSMMVGNASLQAGMRRVWCPPGHQYAACDFLSASIAWNIGCVPWRRTVPVTSILKLS
jgi:hypothetical protein